MKLNIDSTTAQLYRWFYATSRMPESLCPYFWKLVLMWTFILPYSLLCLPVIILERLDRSQTHSTGERASYGFLCWFIMYMIICMVTVFGILFEFPEKDTLYMQFVIVGSTSWAVLIATGIHFAIKYLKEKWESRDIKYDEDGYRIWTPTEPEQDSIIVSFVKASYNKYCPKIDWNHNK
jgi:hypothetical protein